MREAMLYEKLADNRVRCNLCAHHCEIADGKTGICGVRKNNDGVLYTTAYGRAITWHVDPIEKKPLLHFYPASTAYSIATRGCNFRCKWCQNWQIAQVPLGEDADVGEKASPEQVVESATRAGCRSVAYTYTEPTVFFEYSYDMAQLTRDAGLANVYVTNDYMTAEMLDIFHPHLDAASVDLKAFRDETYRRYTGARLAPVLESFKRMKKLGIWLEVTTLVIPGINDETAELRDAAQFVAEELGRDIPWHISRFFPAHKMSQLFPTPLETLREAKEIGLEAGLHYVYCGNVGEETNTFCHNCGRVLIRRRGFRVEENHVAEGDRCPDCGAQVAGVGMSSG